VQQQLHGANYRPTLNVLTLAHAAGWRTRCRRQGRNGRPTYVTRAACSHLTRVDQPKDLS
jgi:hypothetical protein